MTGSHRVARVERELFQLASQFLQLQMSEPLPAFASVTAAEVSPDLKHARIYIRIVGEKEDRDISEEILLEHRKSMQAEVAKKLKMKFCPVLRFVFGHVESLDPVDHMLAQLKNPKSK